MAFGRLLSLVLIAVTSAACQELGLVKQYEYDERVELSLDGSAIVDINASIPALVALRGATLSVEPEARFDRQEFRRLYEGPGVTVREVSAFRRHGRRFVHVRLDVSDIAQLPRLVPLSWSRYRLDRLDGEYRFVQEVGPAAQLQVGDVGWTGDELIAFRVHLPSRINFHNSPLGVERGNILVWEQTLHDRLAGTPLHMEARMETESILYRTLWLFGGTFMAAMAVLALVIWWVSRKGRSAVPA
ncbi:MAG: hypothetical protein EHM55_11340 [Acidobacteria bacterium]|nr:MAG: hypothetical protein EHM55_11340 [Acidobacteriota bacterium]